MPVGSGRGDGRKGQGEGPRAAECAGACAGMKCGATGVAGCPIPSSVSQAIFPGKVIAAWDFCTINLLRTDLKPPVAKGLDAGAQASGESRGGTRPAAFLSSLHDLGDSTSIQEEPSPNPKTGTGDASIAPSGDRTIGRSMTGT